MKRPFACLAAVCLAASFAAADARAQETPRPRANCPAPANIVHLDEALPHLAARIAQREAVTIVALGSSSTAGAGASSLAFTYPARLEVELKAQFPGIPIRVLNRGVGGEDVKEMLERMDTDVAAAKPDLVIWQLGTNAILRDNGVEPEQALILEGLKRLVAMDTDIVLLDPQYAPKVLKDPDAYPMVDLISDIAREKHINLFRRFALMRYWHETSGVPFETFLSPDLLHMNDWSYGCTAHYIGASITEAVSQELAEKPKTKIDTMHAAMPVPATER
ncbi:MAG TPA: GDSL-type esterase/lipase family protein [Xanthobacteraceae bacterium]|nr:GDSL-type esterase/lipase family protein [Xanthobacteraceae bacterium]